MKYKPYKGFFNYFHCIPEILYIVLYICSLLLTKENIEDTERAELSKVMILSFIVIIGVEFLIIILENLRVVGSAVIEIVNKIRNRDKSK